MESTPRKVSEFLKESAKQIAQEPGSGLTTLYMLRLGDDSLYTGITINVDQRIREHESGRGSKYVRSRLPIVECRIVFQNLQRTTALSLEHHLKQLSKAHKEHIFEKHTAKYREVDFSA